jgi:hypothetical protein
VTQLPYWLFLFIGSLGVLIFLFGGIKYKKQGKSFLLGSEFSSIKNFYLSQEKKRILARGIGIICLTVGLMIPGIISTTDLIQPKIVIKPQEYKVKFNFWATSEFNEYSNYILDSMNAHRVNLDIYFRSYENLIEWETRCPNITYRIIVAGNSICDFANNIRDHTQKMLAYENNGTLNQWRGFIADVEGWWFMYNSCVSTWEDAITEYNQLFDFIDSQSVIRGKPIEMECVGWDYQCIDAWDGDDDLQKQFMLPTYIPDRWTFYAPMVYRCWYDEEYGTKPFGVANDSTENWQWSYRIFAQLTALIGMRGVDRTGIYLGISNCTCYGADLPQSEPIYWGNATGYGNLVRDVLICKHFGIKEVTFFLAWTAIENGFSMGGVFESYGDDFLDQINASVNGLSVPSQFEIQYRLKDGRCYEKMALDFVYDSNWWRGQLELGVYAFIAIVIPLSRYYSSKLKEL